MQVTLCKEEIYVMNGNINPLSLRNPQSKENIANFIPKFSQIKQ